MSPFAITDLDLNAVDAIEFAIAIDPATQRVGVAYFSTRATQTMAGVPDYDVKYVEWRQGVMSAVQTVSMVQRHYGIAVLFGRTTGEPIISYLGGTPGSTYWLQSDAVISRRSGGTTWTETVVATSGDQVTCGNAVSDRGFLVGLYPTLALDSTGKLYLAYRDGHDGQFPQQDWGSSDVELWEGNPTPTVGTCLAARGAWGGHNQMVIGASDQPAIIHDQMFGSADGPASNVFFQQRNASTGTWSQPVALSPVANTQTGASLAWDPQEGYGIAVVDRSTNLLSYFNSLNGSMWTAPDLVFGQGSGGWYPSLAMDPVNHEPAIAFYICSPSSFVNETSCRTSEDRLVILQRIVGTWRETLVDNNGGFQPKIGFFASGKRVVVYRTPPALDSAGVPVPGVGALKLAVER